ncbi:hypothetical protein Nepgr_033164 [Nepenthes gracilis]|uniref:Uncharacterized protein n=1 Tax=Nepenthes gracilis TaxID=150966 RepID=A0AAD3Y8U1_NEPGR|nr:hypothetical protein Nepgr_033164 [Nepenthes gracilis]
MADQPPFRPWIWLASRSRQPPPPAPPPAPVAAPQDQAQLPASQPRPPFLAPFRPVVVQPQPAPPPSAPAVPRPSPPPATISSPIENPPPAAFPPPLATAPKSPSIVAATTPPASRAPEPRVTTSLPATMAAPTITTPKSPITASLPASRTPPSPLPSSPATKTYLAVPASSLPKRLTTTPTVTTITTPNLSPKTVKPLAQITIPPPSPLAQPPPFSRSETVGEPQIRAEAEKKTVFVQEAIEKPSPFTHKPSITPIDNYGSDGGKDFQKMTSEKINGVRILTMAGENKGALMELGYSQRTHGIQKGNQDDYSSKNRHASSDGNDSVRVYSGSDSGSKTTDRARRFDAYYMNSNVQGVNNSILFNCSCTHHDPGVHLSLSGKPSNKNRHGSNLKDSFNGQKT